MVHDNAGNKGRGNYGNNNKYTKLFQYGLLFYGCDNFLPFPGKRHDTITP